EAIAAAREKRAVATLETEGSQAGSKDPTAPGANQAPGISASVVGPSSPAFSPPLEPIIPGLHLEAPPAATPTPGLDSLTLRQRVPTRHLDSLPPASGKGNVYSLTLADVPDAEFSAK